MEPRHRAGALAEELAATFLKLQGMTLLGRNVTCAGVEVDILARQDRRLLLVEVKLRRPAAPLVATQALGVVQHRRLRRAADWTLSHCAWATSVRIDVVGISWRPGTASLHVEQVCGVE